MTPSQFFDEPSIAAAARRAIALAKGGDARAGLTLALEARRCARGLDMGHGELEALNAAATVHLIRGDSIAAVAAAMDACVLARKVGNRPIHADAFVSVTIAAYNLGAFEDAAATLARCAHEACELGDVGIELRARLALGIVLGDLGAFGEAKVEYLRALPLSERAGDSTGPARVIANLANLHRKRALAHRDAGRLEEMGHEVEEAVDVAGNARRLAGAEGHLAVEIDALAIEGCALGLAGDGEQAFQRLTASAALGRRSRCPTAVVWVLRELGRNRFAAGELRAARCAYGEALAVAEDMRPSRTAGMACEALAEIDALEGNAAGARLWRERAADETATYEIARLQTRRQIEALLALG